MSRWRQQRALSFENVMLERAAGSLSMGAWLLRFLTSPCTNRVSSVPAKRPVRGGVRDLRNECVQSLKKRPPKAITRPAAHTRSDIQADTAAVRSSAANANPLPFVSLSPIIPPSLPSSLPPSLLPSHPPYLPPSLPPSLSPTHPPSLTPTPRHPARHPARSRAPPNRPHLRPGAW